MDYTRFFASITARRKSNMIRHLTDVYLKTSNAINLASGMPNTTTFPFKEITMTLGHGDNNDSVQKIVDKDLATALQYSASQGYFPLIEKWRMFQKHWHSPRNENWDVAFTTGSMDACSKFFEMFVDEGQPIMVQSPTYTGILGAMHPLQPDFIGIEQDSQGIIPEQIIQACEERLKAHRPLPKFLYVNPTGANPTGTNLSEGRRRQVYELAQKYDFLIIEDDAYYFLHFEEKRPTSLFSLDTDGRVIRLDTFSKIMSAGLRVGVVTAHKDLLSKLIVHVENSCLHASTLSQMMLYKALETWGPQGLEEHFKHVQSFYRRNRDIMLALLQKHLSGLAEWNIPQGGMFVWLKVKGIDDALDLVMNKCVPKGIFILPGNAFNYDPKKPEQHIRLSYSYASSEEIEKGLIILASIIRQETSK